VTCEEFQALAPAYAIGALDAGERIACDAHLAEAEHRGCHEALTLAREAGTLMAESLSPVAPSPETWARIEQRTTAGSRRGLAWAGWAVAAAAVLLLVWVAMDRDRMHTQLALNTAAAAHEARARAECKTELAHLQTDAHLRQQALDLLQRTGTRLIALDAQGGAEQTARLIYNPAGQGFLVGGGMRTPEGKDYELWFIRGDRKIPAGLLRGAVTGGLVAAIDPTLLAGSSPDAVAITLEPVGGSPQPRGPILLVGKI
jgi:anti-sigma-K factor RskA